MYSLVGLKGAYLNNYAQPSEAVFKARAVQADYVVIKYGMGQYEQWVRDVGIPWLAEIYPYRTIPYDDGLRLAQQAQQPGCIGAVVNPESGTSPGVADWDNDDGWAMRTFVNTFRANAPAGMPLYASIDTRGYRPSKPYQKVLLEQADGVFPMLFPQEFQQATSVAIDAVLSGIQPWRTAGKPVIVTFQGYNHIGAEWVTEQIQQLNADVLVDGINIYTIGHASDAEWAAFVAGQFEREYPVADAELQAKLDAQRTEYRELIGNVLGTLGQHGKLIDALAGGLFSVAQTVYDIQRISGDGSTTLNAKLAELTTGLDSIRAEVADFERRAAEAAKVLSNG